MATYTDNYQLTKPTYAEQADIGVINSNMNIIDDIMHSSQVSLAPAYDQSQTYAEGDVVMYELLMYKCISPTTGNWDASKWERTTASESGGGGSAELDILGEGNGAVVTFSDGASAELAKCIAEIEPVQDLHGYSKPWAGGAGKNKIIKKIETSNISSAGQIENYNPAYDVYVAKIINGVTYYPTTGNMSYEGFVYALFTTEPSRGDYAYNNMRYVTAASAWTAPMDGYIAFRTSRNYATPQFEVGNTPTTYEPYANICPISGSTSVTVTVSDGETSTTKTTPLGQTVYGGQLNVLTGELTVTHVCKTLTTADLNISYVSAASDANSYYYNLTNAFSSGEIVNDASGRSNIFKWYRNLYTDRTVEGTTGQGAYVSVRVNSSRVADTSPDALKAYLPATWQVYAKLNTPQTVQLTPQEVNSLLGQNNISADTGDIDIVYVKASAPIQPNPTGTPTATLKKLGIEGTVFEVEGGGGGSSETIITGQERVVGTYNNKPLYQLDVQADDIAGNVNIAQAPTSLGRLVSYTGCAYDRTNDQYVALPLFATNSYYMRLYIYSGNVYMEMPSSIHVDVSLSLRYTKITD